MPTENTKLARIMLRATFFPGLNARLASLDTLMSISERQLDAARSEEIIKLRREHRQLGKHLHQQDREFELSELEDQVTHLLPKLFRGGYVLTLWSVFERSLMDVAIRAADYREIEFPQDYFRKGSFFPAMRDALDKCVGISAFPNKEEYKHLRVLNGVRQTLLHHDGRFAEAPSAIKSLSAGELEGLGLTLERDNHFQYVVPSTLFLESGTTLVKGCVHRIALQSFNKLTGSGA
jgi:hypothetical protein